MTTTTSDTGVHTVRVIGFDPSTTCSGWALFNASEFMESYVRSGFIKASVKDAPIPLRVGQLLHTAKYLLDRYEPSYVYVEQPHYNVKSANPYSTAMLCYATGVVVGAAFNYLMERFSNPHERLVEANPMTWKSQLLGHGKATKKQIKQIIQTLYPETQNVKVQDEFDAIGIAGYGARMVSNNFRLGLVENYD